jgi:signal transduction histidine kinase
MSLRSKVVILLSLVMLLYAAIDHLLQRTFVYGTFVALEEASAQKDILRVRHAIDSEVKTIEADAQAWASSDEIYLSATGGDPAAFRKSLLQRIEGRPIHVLYVCDGEGGVIAGIARDFTGNPISVRELPQEKFNASHPLLQLPPSGAKDKNGSPIEDLHGVYLTDKGPLLVAAASIKGSIPKQTPRGVIIVGRFLDRDLCKELRQQTETSFEQWPIDGRNIPEVAPGIVAQVSSSPDEPVYQNVNEQHLSAYLAYPDIRGFPALLLRANLDRAATEHGSWAVRYALVSTVAAGLLMMLVLLNMMQRTVLKPLAQLTEHAVNIGRSDDFTRRIGSGVARADEVGILTREFDSMIEKVAQSRAALVDTARAAGMSEIATGVLHNVGNVLNSVNVSATLVAQKARGGAPEDFKKVVELLRPSADDLAGFIQRDPRGKHLYPLLDSLATQLVNEQSTLLVEVTSLTSGIEHIKELVQAQQGFAGRAGVREVLSVAQLIDSAAAITERGVQGSSDIEIVREYETMDACPVDRHRLMEIFVNLIQNARQSLLESDQASRRLTLRLRKVRDDCLRVEVVDNGVGIPAENLARVFNHGFSTKKGGHGFGLHSSANAATEMHGKLTADSPGTGRGATFVLEFPLQTVSTAGAAS